jgi:hypothetical protein
MPSFSHSKPRHRQWTARVVLPFEHTPVFPARCPGCGKEKPPLVWQPDPARLPFSGKLAYYLNHRMLPAIDIPICEVCIDHMPGSDQGLGVVATSVLVPAMLLLATLLFYALQMEAAAALTGLACLVWFVLAARAVWVLQHSTLFDVQLGRNDQLIYSFRDPEYAAHFDALNQERTG